MIFLWDLTPKTLKIIASLIIISLITIIVLVGVTAEKPQKEEKEVISEIINNNEKVVHHSGDVYSYTNIFRNNRWSNVLLKLPIDFNDKSTRMIIQEFSVFSENITLNFENNRLFYMYGPDTYMYNIIQNRIDRFCEGELQFLCEGNSFVTLFDGNLYKGEYYPATYFAKSFKKLTDGSFKKFDEDENRVYYSSSTGASNTLVVALDKTTLNIILIDNFKTNKQELQDIMVTDNYVYELIKGNDGQYIRKVSKEMKEENEDIEFEILPIENAEYVELIDSMYVRALNSTDDSIIRDDLYFFIADVEAITNDNLIDYKILNKTVYKYDESKNKVDLYTGIFNELWIDNYYLVQDGKTVSLYNKNNYITSIETQIAAASELELVNVNVIGDYLYYEFEIKNENVSEIVFARTLRKGGESQRINIIE